MTEKKEQILQTALRLFSEQGYDATPTSQIAREANVSEGLIFRHFINKDGLMDALLELGQEHLQPFMDDIIMDANHVSAIHKMIDLPILLIQKERAFWTLQLSLKWQRRYRKHDVGPPAYMLPLMQRLIFALAALQWENPALEANILYFTLDGLVNQLITQPEMEGVDTIIALLKSKYG
jgi:AcrR family transcriptional regulator